MPPPFCNFKKWFQPLHTKYVRGMGDAQKIAFGWGEGRDSGDKASFHQKNLKRKKCNRNFFNMKVLSQGNS
jgi:hypothetical protein